MDYEVSILGKERVITRKDIEKHTAQAVTFDQLLLLLGAGDLRGPETKHIKEIVIESPTFVVEGKS